MHKRERPLETDTFQEKGTKKPLLKKYRKVFALLILCLGFPLIPTYAQDSFQSLTLEKAINHAMQNSRSMKSAALAEKLSKEETREVISTGMPQINASGRLVNNVKIPTQVLPAEIAGGPKGSFIPVQFGTQYNASGSIEATQLLYSQSYLVGLKASKVAQEVSKLNTRRAKEELAYNVSITFYSVQISGKQLDILKSNLANIRKLIEISELQYKNGVLKKVYLDRLKVNQTNLETQVQNLETAHQQQLNTLKFLMALPLDMQVTLDTTINETQAKGLVLNNDVNIFQNRTEYQLLNKKRELYVLDKKNNQAGYFPTLAAFANYNWHAFRQEFDFFNAGKQWFPSSAIGLSLNIPIFDGLQKRSNIQQSKIKLAQTENDAEILKESIQLDIINANNKLSNSKRALATQEENRKLAEEVHAQTQLEYQQGFASLSDLLNAETEMKEAQNNYINALVEMLIAGLELRKADGSLIAAVEAE